METSTPEANFQNLELAIKLANELRGRICHEMNYFTCSEIRNKYKHIEEYGRVYIVLSEILNMENVQW